MMQQLRCSKNSEHDEFIVHLVSNTQDPNDTNNYLTLECLDCGQEMMFVVDLTPEFDRAAAPEAV